MDGDTAGKAAVHRSALVALEHITEGKSLNYILLPENMDPDQIIRDKGRENMASILAQKIDLSELVWNFEVAKIIKRTPEEIALFEKNIMDLAATIKNNSVRSYYLKFFRDKIWNEFKRANSHNKTVKTKGSSFNMDIRENLNEDEHVLIAIIINQPTILTNKEIYEEYLSFRFRNKISDAIRNIILELLEKIDSHIISKKDILDALVENKIEFKDSDIKLDTNYNVCVNMWNIASRKYLVNNIEKEYKELVLRQDEQSFEKAKLLRGEMIKLNEEIVKLQSEIDDEQFQL